MPRSAVPAVTATQPARPRKLPATSPLAYSVLRPRILAQDRLRLWTSQYGLLRDIKNAQILPKEAREVRANAILSSVEFSTLKTYSSGLLRFHEFCDSFAVNEADRMPTSDYLLSSFVAHHLGRVGKSAVDNWIAGLQLWHNVHDAPWLGGRALTAASKGVVKNTPQSSYRPKRAPVTVEHIRCLRQHLDLSNAMDATVYAVAAVAFRGCCRLDELVTASEVVFDSTRQVTRGATVSFKKSGSGTLYAQFHIPWSKATGIRGADIILTATGDDACAVEALQHHLAVNRSVPGTAPLFGWTTADGGWAPLTRSWFLKRCAEIWTAHGLDVVPGHSFRIGGTTDLLLRGVEPGVVALQGRWSSGAFLKYWRQVEVILPMFLSRAAPHVSQVSIAASIARFEAQLV